MTESDVLAEFRAADALLQGHFVLSSGKHSANYLQCARVLMNPERASRLANNRLVSLLEGGYDLQGLSFSVAAHVKRLMKG